MEWIQAHWAELGVALLAFQNFGKSVAEMTKTDKDDKFFAKLGTMLGYFFLGKRAGN
jgi:hypothetical protein